MGLFSIFKFLFIRFVEVVVVLTLIVIMPNIPPDAKISEPYKVVKHMPFEKGLSLNERLASGEIWHKGEIFGPEAFADYKGELYTSVLGGDIVKLNGEHITPVVKFGKPCKGFFEEQICGRPLGMAFDKNGVLYAADAYYGIYKVDVTSGRKTQLVSKNDEIGGKKCKLFNSVLISENGEDLYFTDSSTEFLLEDGLFDMLADGSGRLIHYNLKTKTSRVLIENIHFANGVAFNDDESFIIVSETARGRLLRYHLKGSKAGKSDIFIDGLPGLPDNLKSDGKGGFFVPLVTGKDDKHPIIFHSLSQFPRIRRLISRLLGLVELGFKLVDQIYPNELAQKGRHFVGHFTSGQFVLALKRVSILHVSGNGEILDSVHTNSGKFDGISEAHIFNGMLYLGSPFNDYIVKVPLEKIGWERFGLKKAQTQTTTPRPSTTTPKPTTTTQKPTTTTQRPTTTTQRPTTTTQRPTTTTQRPTTTQKAATTTQKPSTTTQKPVTTTQKPSTTTTQRPTTTTPKPVVTQKPAATAEKVVKKEEKTQQQQQKERQTQQQQQQQQQQQAAKKPSS